MWQKDYFTIFGVSTQAHCMYLCTLKSQIQNPLILIIVLITVHIKEACLPRLEYWAQLVMLTEIDNDFFYPFFFFFILGSSCECKRGCHNSGFPASWRSPLVPDGGTINRSQSLCICMYKVNNLQNCNIIVLGIDYVYIWELQQTSMASEWLLTKLGILMFIF